jgi:hypothetical protein
MRSFGLNLDPEAPLSASVKPFVPTVLGEGGIGQFKTYAELGTGTGSRSRARCSSSSASTSTAGVQARCSPERATGSARRQRGSEAADENKQRLPVRRGMAARCIVLARHPTAGDGHVSPPSTPAVRVSAAIGSERSVRIAAAAPGRHVIIPAGVYREHLGSTSRSRSSPMGRRVDRRQWERGHRRDHRARRHPPRLCRSATPASTSTRRTPRSACSPARADRDNILEDILFGIDLREAPDSRVRGNRIGGKDLDIARRGDGLRLWRSDRTLIENNTIHDGRDAILWYSKGVVVRGNTAPTAATACT